MNFCVTLFGKLQKRLFLMPNASGYPSIVYFSLIEFWPLMEAWFPVCFTHSAILSLCIQSTSERWSIGPLCLRCPILSQKTIFTHFLKFEIMKYVMWKSISLELLKIYSLSWIYTASLTLPLFLILAVRLNHITNYKRNLRFLRKALLGLLR